MAARPWFGCALAAFCLASCISPNVALIQCSENATANGSSTDESWRICVKEQEGSTSSGEPTPVVGSGCKCNTRRGDPQSDFMPAEKQCCENNEYVCNTCLFNGKCQEKEWCDKATNLIMWGLGGGLLTVRYKALLFKKVATCPLLTLERSFIADGSMLCIFLLVCTLPQNKNGQSCWRRDKRWL